MRGTKEVVESRLELIDEKYKTSEKIQEVEGKLNTLKARFENEVVATAVKFESQSKMMDTINNFENELRDLRNSLMHSSNDPAFWWKKWSPASRIGELQRIPAEVSTVENIGEKIGLHVETVTASGRIVSVKILNKDVSGEKIRHEISIEEMDSRAIANTINEIIETLIDMKNREDQIESKMLHEIERMQKEGKLLVRTPGTISVGDLPKHSLPGGIMVRRSRYDIQDIFFIIKGTEKEDTAIEPPFKIEVEGKGDFVSVSKGNIQPLVETLTTIRQDILLWLLHQEE